MCAGGVSLDLARMYPSLKFVIQDRAPILEKARGIWGAQNPQALEEKRVEFQPHNFFKQNPRKGADIYFLRYIMYVHLRLCCS